MKAFILLLALAAGTVHAGDIKNCNELKKEIAKKIEHNLVTNYSLEIVGKSANARGKQVGTCENGTKKIMYQRH